jgi:hypothetical protein
MAIEVFEEDRKAVGNRLANSPLGSLDPAASLLVVAGFCPLCGNGVQSLRDELSLKEWRISGLCQSCQDETFGFDGEAMSTPVDPSTLEG